MYGMGWDRRDWDGLLYTRLIKMRRLIYSLGLSKNGSLSLLNSVVGFCLSDTFMWQ